MEAWQKGEAVPVLSALAAMQTLGWDTGAMLGALETALRARPHLRSTAQPAPSAHKDKVGLQAEEHGNQALFGGSSACTFAMTSLIKFKL